jgi:hypothetical protein
MIEIRLQGGRFDGIEIETDQVPPSVIFVWEDHNGQYYIADQKTAQGFQRHPYIHHRSESQELHYYVPAHKQ